MIFIIFCDYCVNSSVLVGKASVGGDWNVVLACAVSILGNEMTYKKLNCPLDSETVNFIISKKLALAVH